MQTQAPKSARTATEWWEARRAMATEERPGRHGPGLDLIDGCRDEVPLADCVEKAKKLGYVGATHYWRVLAGAPIEHLTADLLAATNGK